MTFLFRAHNIGKTFPQPDGKNLTALENISFDLSPGEIVCMLGASGSGKTTLLRILSGLDTAYSGKIESGIQRPGPQMGYLSQNDRLLPWRSAAGNVALGLELTGQDKANAHQVALAALQQVGLVDFAEHHPAQLSGGMQQRVLLARMFALQPKLLLLDEPMSNLDVLARRDLAILIKNYTRTHKAATLVVTHSIEEACFLADRILLVTRMPAHISKEIRLADETGHGDALERGKALDVVMNDLWRTLGTTP